MSAVASSIRGVGNCGSWLQSLILLFVRVYWGYAFMMAGWGKFHNIESVISFFESSGIWWPQFNAYLVASFEFVGGISLILGLFSRVFAVPLTIVMIVAYFTADYVATAGGSVPTLVSNLGLLEYIRTVAIYWATHLDKFITATPFQFMLTTLLVWAFGPGFFSCDRVLKL